MNLYFNLQIAKNYNSKSQIARVLTENWVKSNVYCPCCGEVPLFDEAFDVVSQKYGEEEIILDSPKITAQYRQKLKGFNTTQELDLFLVNEPKIEYAPELIF